jgi:hypothetical protein
MAKEMHIEYNGLDCVFLADFSNKKGNNRREISDIGELARSIISYAEKRKLVLNIDLPFSDEKMAKLKEMLKPLGGRISYCIEGKSSS